MAQYNIATDEKVKEFVKTVLEQKIVPNMMKIKETELINYYSQQKNEFYNIMMATQLPQDS